MKYEITTYNERGDLVSIRYVSARTEDDAKIHAFNDLLKAAGAVDVSYREVIG